MLFDEGRYEPLHFERNCLPDDHYVELMFLARRHKFVLRPGLVHLMTCRLKNERTRGQQTLIPSGTENHCHNEFRCPNMLDAASSLYRISSKNISQATQLDLRAGFTARC